jgi:tRNA (cytosine34-C5)-methyltransferase
MRKNPDIWPKWNAASGTNLHGVQYRILRRGVELLGKDHMKITIV